MSKLPYFKFYPQDFLVGTSFMTPSEVGGYIRLLCTAWENGGIPRDSKVISRITGCDSAECLNILEKFEIVDDKFYNKRLESERNNLIDRSKVNSDNAKQRWERNANAMQSHSERICERICETVCESDAYQKSEVRSQKSEVKEKKIKKETKENTRGFTPPSFNQVSDYCKERKNNINANSFINFYESKGWMVGKTKMKDWEACVRTWEQRETINKEKDDPMWRVY